MKVGYSSVIATASKMSSVSFTGKSTNHKPVQVFDSARAVHDQFNQIISGGPLSVLNLPVFSLKRIYSDEFLRILMPRNLSHSHC